MPSFNTFHRVGALYFGIFCGDSWMFTVCELGNVLAIFRSLGFYSWPLAFNILRIYRAYAESTKGRLICRNKA